MGSIARAEAPTSAYHKYSTQLLRVRRLTQTNHIDLTQPVKPAQIEALKDNLMSQREMLVNHMMVNGIRRAARNEEGDSAFDLLANHTALLVKIDAVLTAISGISMVTIPSVETSALKDKLDALKTEITVV